MWWWNGDGGYWFGPWIFAPFMMVFWLLVIGAVIYFVARGGMSDRGLPRGRSLEILKERFARGEITQAQYEEQRRLLSA